MLLAGFLFLHFAATIRTALVDAEARAGGSVQLARVAFAGAITGIAGMVMAIVIISSATTEGADANPVVTRAIASSSAGPFLLSAMGFAALLLTAGLLTLRSGVFARWTGVVALIGGGLGLLIAWAIISRGDPTNGLLPAFYFPVPNLVLGVALVLVLGIGTGLLPALQAQRLKIVTALRRA